MSLFYILIKLYPFIGLALVVLCFDLVRHLRRTMNKSWMGVAAMGVFFFIGIVLWIVKRGDLHSDEWFDQLVFWLKLK